VKMDEKIDKLADLLVQWNKREVSADHAMYKIYKLFTQEFLKKWNEVIK
jgi:hypothetical protein